MRAASLDGSERGSRDESETHRAAKDGAPLLVTRFGNAIWFRSVLSWLGHSPRRKIDAALGVLLLLCLTLPLMGRDSSLRMEASEIGIAGLPMAEAWWAIERGVVETPVPFGHLVTRLSLTPGLWGGRILSLSFGVLGVLVIGRMAGRLFGPWEASAATAVAATVPIVATLSGAASTLSLFLFISGISLYTWYRGLTTRARWAWPAYILSGIVMVYTHHVGLLLLLAEAGAVGIDALVWSLTQHRTRRVRSGLPYVQYIFSAVLVVLAFLPWMLNKDVFPRGYAESSLELSVISPAAVSGFLTDLTAGLPAAAPIYAVLLVLGVWDALRRVKASGARGKLYVDVSHRRPMMLLVVAALVFFPAAVAASFASRVALNSRSLAPLVVMAVVLLARGITALGRRTWRDPGWGLKSPSTVVVAVVLVVGTNVAGYLSGAAERVGGGRDAATRLREFLRGSVGPGDLLAVSGRSDLVGLGVWAVPDGIEATAAWSQRPGVLLARVASHDRAVFLARDVVERSGRLSEHIVIEGAAVVGVVDIGNPEHREALSPGWGRDIEPREAAPWSRAFLLAKRGSISVRLSRRLPNAVVLHVFNLKLGQTLSLAVNGIPCGAASVRRGWSVLTIPVEERSFRRNSLNTIVLHFSSMNPSDVPGGRPFAVIADLLLLERRLEPRALSL